MHCTIEVLMYNLSRTHSQDENGDRYLYVETGAYKPYMPATVEAAKRRGCRVVKRCRGVYYVYAPKGAS